MKNKTVIRSMEILQLFVEHAELSFQEIIELSDIPKSTTYRMLETLEEMKFLEKGEDLKYRLGTIFITYGSLVLSRLDLHQIAYPIMKDLHDDVEEAINLTIQENNEALYIEKIDAKQKVKLYTAVGRRSPLYAGACSRVMLSYMQDEQIEDYLENVSFKKYANGTPETKEDLYQSVQEVRKKGYAISYSELENHTCSIAAPIFDHKGEIVAGISIAGLDVNYQNEKVAFYANKAIEAANLISKQLGYRK